MDHQEVSLRWAQTWAGCDEQKRDWENVNWWTSGCYFKAIWEVHYGVSTVPFLEERNLFHHHREVHLRGTSNNSLSLFLAAQIRQIHHSLLERGAVLWSLSSQIQHNSMWVPLPAPSSGILELGSAFDLMECLNKAVCCHMCSATIFPCKE